MVHRRHPFRPRHALSIYRHALSLYRRPVASVPDMNAALIERGNQTVGPDDDVWHLGDFALRTSAREAAALVRSADAST